jgi:hypothetical protein
MRSKRMLLRYMMSGGLSAATLAAAVCSGSAAQEAKLPRVLVYTRNYTPDGKGYVHDNIAASVEAIRKMGAESGFGRFSPMRT